MFERFRSTKRANSGEIYPDEILLDARNMPSFNKDQFEGQLEQPIAKYVPSALGVFSLLILLMLLGRVGYLQFVRGAAFRERSVTNSLRYIPDYAARGTIYDRNGKALAWNDTSRTYSAAAGFGHLLGYVGYPREAELAKEKYEPKELVGIEGVEYTYNRQLEGEKGRKLIEIDALGKVQSEAINVPSRPGTDLTLSIDSGVQVAFYESIKAIALDRGFSGGAGVMMDVRTGEVLALTSYPEYDPNELAPRDTPRVKLADYFTDKRQPFLNRAVHGLYTPGSVVKPILALAALEEGVISPQRQILSTGALRLPNPYNPGQESVFKDWKEHGLVDMRRAIAVSSDEYFYQIGGGYKSQPGLGIANIEKYSRLFGLAEKTGIALKGEPKGTIPSPEWKAAHFDGEAWRIGDTYHTAIGQYGYQVTPLEMVRAIAAIANKGQLLHPQLLRDASSTMVSVERVIPIAGEKFTIIHEGMRMATEVGTAIGINVPYVEIAAKTGTAELGVSKAYVNSWVTGFFPYEHPRYAFVVVMERGKRANTIGAVATMRRFLDWMQEHVPEYFE